jgi:hypothetical protein
MDRPLTKLSLDRIPKKLYELSSPAVVQLGNLPGDGKME